MMETSCLNSSIIWNELALFDFVQIHNALNIFNLAVQWLYTARGYGSYILWASSKCCKQDIVCIMFPEVPADKRFGKIP